MQAELDAARASSKHRRTLMPSGVCIHPDGFEMSIQSGPGRLKTSTRAETVAELNTNMAFMASGLCSTLVRILLSCTACACMSQGAVRSAYWA